MYITAVIVAYNRLPLLKECIHSLRLQTRKPDAIMVINNSSTDGTGEWLAGETDLVVFTVPNRGGAGGFNEGVKQAYKHNSDWIWMMDDDSIPEPGALHALVTALEVTKEAGDRFGFFGSKVLFTDRTDHLMNIQVQLNKFEGKKDKHFYHEHHIHPVEFSSFVSLLVSKEVVGEVGLPISEFFIWGDDVEYTKRIVNAGYYGALVSNSIVIHKTPVNYSHNVFTDSASNIWKHKYGVRNQLYIRRQRYCLFRRWQSRKS
ncbi:MAG: glycosyltransferase [Sphingobacteriales bacterium]|nr:MAG: glycosyltransferase [Sphingobacteriales bacterium]